MKKLLILLLAVSMILCIAACGADDDSSETPSTSTSTSSGSSNTSSDETSSAATSSTATSSENTPEASSAATTTDESTDDSSVVEGEPLEWEVAEGISQFVGWTGDNAHGNDLMGTFATSATAIQLTAINESPVDGIASVIAFNYDYGPTIESDDGSYDDYNILVFEYDHSIYGYKMTKLLGVDDAGKDDVEIPDDGYVLAVHKNWQSKVNAMKEVDATQTFFPHGFRATDALDAKIKSGTATIDGAVSDSEYGAPIWLLEPDDIYTNYSQFDEQVDITAAVYMMYDEQYLYIGVVVDSPYHYLPVGGALWANDAIQVNVTSIDPMDDYFMASNLWNYGSNTGMSLQAGTDNVARQYGFGVDDAGTTVDAVYFAGGTTESLSKCIRDDANQTTTYEVAIPLAECGKEGETIKGEKGTVIGVSISANQGNEAESTWRTVLLRDGGGIIGINDLTKIPTITFN